MENLGLKSFKCSIMIVFGIKYKQCFERHFSKTMRVGGRGWLRKSCWGGRRRLRKKRIGGGDKKIEFCVCISVFVCVCVSVFACV